MPAWLAPAIAAVGTYISATSQNAAQAQLSREQMKWQKMMSDTAHQREVADLRAAGLNPMLSFSGGGASTPSGTMPTAHEVIGPAMNSALAVRRAALEMKTMKQNLELQKLSTHANIRKTQQDTRVGEANETNIRTATELARNELPGARAQAAFDRSEVGKFLRALRNVTGSILPLGRINR